MTVKAPFEPTTCSCRADRKSCQRQPGHLLPGQLKEIADALGLAVEAARRYFWNSPGMVLANSRTGRTFRVRTITPRFENGRCVFFKNERCEVHAVAPFGCRFFDVHMSAAEGQRRSMWGAREILDRLAEYAEERDPLPEATHYRPLGGRP